VSAHAREQMTSLTSLYIKRSKVKYYRSAEAPSIILGKVSVRTYMSVTLGVDCLVTNDVIMRTEAANAVGARRANDVITRTTS